MKPRLKLFSFVALTLCAASFCDTARAQLTIYDNTTNFAGTGGQNGGATSTNKKTYLVADDLTYNPVFALAPVTSFKFSLANFNTTSQALTPTVAFYDSNGTNGGPGTLLASFTFNPITLNGSSVSLLTYNVPVAQQFTLSLSGTIWAGMFFTGTQAAGVINKFGQGIFDPPTVGSSQDRDFISSTRGPTGSNPAGTIETSPFTNAVASYGWQLSTTVVPEPASVALLAFGGASLLVAAQRRRNRR